TEAMSALGMWGTLLVNGTIGTNNDITVFNPDGSTFFDAGVSCSTVGIGMDGCFGSKLLEVNGTFQADDYYSGDGTQGYTGSCGSGTTLTVKDGLITGCS
ncbi:MAG: hypothetical protein U9R08_03730, partial [Nanoarchaeota archaeon]|nr:hypothetical protein [Nanoarchaeota archaeon]